jgi:molybdenum-dependent DNA-binding transcriptional regulator ModE
MTETGSISAATRGMDLAHRRAWLLVDEFTQSLHSLTVNTAEAK